MRRWVRDAVAAVIGLAIGWSLVAALGPDGAAPPERPPPNLQDDASVDQPPAPEGTTVEAPGEPESAGGAPQVPEGSDQSDTVLIRGTVTELDDAPVSGAEIVVRVGEHEELVGTSDTQGRFEVRVPLDAAVVRARQGMRASFSIPPLSGAFREGERVDIQLLFETRTVLVRVVSESGVPVAGAQVKASTAEKRPRGVLKPKQAAVHTASTRAECDDNGEAALRDVPTTDLWVVAAATGFERTRVRVRSQEDTVTLRLRHGVVVRGCATGLSSGTPGPYVVRGTTPKGRDIGVVDEDGNYELTGLQAGFIRLELIAPDGAEIDSWESSTAAGDVVRWDPVVNATPELSGVVIDLNSEPLEGWHVVAVSAEGVLGATRSAADGSFSLSAPEGAVCSIRVSPPEGGVAVVQRERVQAGTSELRLVCEERVGRLEAEVRAEEGFDAGASMLCVIPRRVDAATAPLRPATGWVLGVRGSERTARTKLLPPGIYDVFLHNSRLGVHHVGEQTVSDTGVHQIPAITLPQPGFLTLESVGGGSGDARLVREIGIGRDARTVWETVLRTGEEIPLLPGRYALQRRNGDERREVEVSSGQSLTVTLP